MIVIIKIIVIIIIRRTRLIIRRTRIRMMITVSQKTKIEIE